MAKNNLPSTLVALTQDVLPSNFNPPCHFFTVPNTSSCGAEVIMLPSISVNNMVFPE